MHRSLRRLVAACTTGALLAALTVSSVNANLPGSLFEGDDGNVVVNTAGNKDWASGLTFTGANDLATGGADNSFAGGSKEDELNVTVGDGSIPNSKADLGRFAAGSEIIAGDVYLYLAWTRNSQSGTTNFDFEINAATQPDLTTVGAKTLVRTAGDVLISYDFAGGAQKPTLTFREWTGTAWGAAQSLGGTVSEAEVNRAGPVTESLASGGAITRPAFQFGEAAINLTDAGIIDPGACAPFSSIYVKSRSSNSFSSTMKDFIAPIPVSLTNCGTIVINKVTVPSPDPTSTNFTFNPSWKSSFTLADGGTNTTTDVAPGAYSITETVPSNWVLTSFTCDQGETPASLDVGAGETVTCTATNTLQLGAIKITKTSSKSGDELAGATFSVTKGGTAISGSPFTTDANGEICVDGLQFGAYVVTETGAPTGYEIDDTTGHTVTVDNTTDCDADPYAGESIGFTDTPTADIQVRFRDGGSGETQLGSLGMTCTDVSSGSSSTADTSGWDDTLTVTGLNAPITLTCTIDIDP